MTGAYKNHRKEVLLDKTLAQLPATMPKVVLKRKTDMKKNELNHAKDALRMAQMRVNDVKLELFKLENTTLDNSSHSVIRCSQTNCRGFLNHEHQCGLCETVSCSDCMCIKRPGHVCSVDDLSTTAYIKSQTKPCPSCGERISKVNGCDQMWCIVCHQAFSWNTGRLMKGVVHNPHYFQYHRGRGFNPCEATDIPPLALRNRFIQMYKRTRLGRKIINVIQLVTRIHYELPNIQQHVQQAEDTVPLQIDYLMGNLSKLDLENKLYALDNKRIRNQYILNVFTMLNQISLEMLWGIFNAPIEQQSVLFKGELQKFMELFEYCNQQWLNMSVDLSFSVPWFEIKTIPNDGIMIDFILKKPIYKEYIAQGNKDAYGNKKISQNLLIYLE